MPDSEAGRSASAPVDAVANEDEESSDEFRQLLWSVGAVSAQLDIARPTLRTWDRRYSLGPSLRTAGGHRRYTAVDVSRVKLMNRLLDTGVTAAEAAQTARDATPEQLVHAAPPTDAGRRSAGDRRRSSSTVETLVRAACDLHAEELARAVSVQLERRGALEAWQQVFAPFLIETGRQWAQGRFGIESEHLASGILAAELRAFASRQRSRRPMTARVLLTCAEDDQHALPLFALEAALAQRKIASLVLGQRVPVSALQQAILVRQPAVVFVWASIAQPADVGAGWNLKAEAASHMLLGGPGWGDRAAPSDGHLHVERVHDLESALARIEHLLQS